MVLKTELLTQLNKKKTKQTGGGELSSKLKTFFFLKRAL